jgi:hypothetical protein
VILPLIIGAAVALSVAGIVILLRRGWLGVIIVVAILVPPAVTFGISVTRQHLIYSSYVIYALPGLLAFVALGVAGLAGWLRRWRGGPVLAGIWFLIAVGGFAVFTSPTRSWLMHNPLQAIRGSVVASRGSLNPLDSPEILTASFCIPPYLYDPQMVRLDSARDFIELLHRADREERTLVINIGMPWAAREFSPKMWSLLQNDDLFGNRQHFQGFDGGLDRIIATYKGGSAARFDFSEYEGAGR